MPVPRRLSLLAFAVIATGIFDTWRAAFTGSVRTRPPVRTALQADTRPDKGHGKLSVDGVTEVMEAAYEGNVEDLTLLGEMGDDLNAQNEYGWTAFRYAVRNNRAKAALALLCLGADPDIASTSGRTPLMSAVGNDLVKMVELMAKHGVNMAKRDLMGRTAYDIADNVATLRLVHDPVRDPPLDASSTQMLKSKKSKNKKHR